jgi:hypothetical protein
VKYIIYTNLCEKLKVKPKSRQQQHRPNSSASVNGGVVGDGSVTASGNIQDDVAEDMCLFYPNGTKSICMRTSIQESMRKIRQDSINPPNRRPKSRNDKTRGNNKKQQQLDQSYSHFLENELTNQRTSQVKAQAKVKSLPLRTSLLDRPFTAASTSSIMKERGKTLEVNRPSTAGGYEGGGGGERSMEDMSCAELKRSLRSSHGRLQIAMMHKTPDPNY